MTRRNRIFLAAPLALLLITGLALALPAVGAAAETGGIKGTVTGEGAGGLESVEVCAYPVSGGGEFECTITLAGGAYEIAGIAAGQYKVEFLPFGTANFVWQYYDGTQSWEAATSVTVTAGAVTPAIDATLAKGAKISGRVTVAATGLPQKGAEVCAEQVAGSGFECAETNAAGEYTIERLAAGQWDVYFSPVGSGLLPQAYLNKELTEAPTPVTVTTGGTLTGINAAFKPGGAIGGTVRLAATNAPLAGVRVCLTEAGLLKSLGCLTTPASGGYRFTNVWASSFKVVFSAEAGDFPDPNTIVDAYPTQWWNGQSSFAAATPIVITPQATVLGIDAHLGPPAATSTPTPMPSAPSATSTPAPKKRKALRCRRGFAKRKVHGRARCVKLHKAVRHRKHDKK